MLDRVRSSPGKVSKRLRQLLYFLSHPISHADYLRVLKAARKRGVAGTDPLLAVKYLGVYLVDSMSTKARREALSFHFDFLTRKIVTFQLGRAWTEGTVIWHRCDQASGHEYSVHLERAALSPLEGESQLRFTMDSLTLCTLTFSFLCGACLGLPQTESLFIGGVQGGANCREQIRIAAKANGEIAPASLLLIAAKAIAEAFEVGFVVGVSHEGQAAMGYAREKISLNYDAMWLEAGAERTASGYFVVEPGLEKPLEEVSSKHRSRTRRKRALKIEIRREIVGTVRGLFGLAPPHLPPPERWDHEQTLDMPLPELAPLSVERRMLQIGSARNGQ